MYVILWTEKDTMSQVDACIQHAVSPEQAMEYVQDEHPECDVWVYEVGDLLRAPDWFPGKVKGG